LLHRRRYGIGVLVTRGLLPLLALEIVIP